MVLRGRDTAYARDCTALGTRAMSYLQRICLPTPSVSRAACLADSHVVGVYVGVKEVVEVWVCALLRTHQHAHLHSLPRPTQPMHRSSIAHQASCPVMYLLQSQVLKLFGELLCGAGVFTAVYNLI